MAGNKEVFQKAMNQGHSAAWDQEWEKAAEFYSAALEEFPNHPQALSSLGLALFEQQDFPAALECYQKAATLSPEDPVPHEKIARIYERMGRLSDAITASLQCAEMHLKARSAEKAIENWNHVLSLQPENVNVRTKLAAVYERLGRLDQAVSEYISTASLMQRSGDTQRAAKFLEHAMQIQPSSQEARMAYSMLRGGKLLPKPARPHGGTGPMRMAHVRQMEGRADGSDSEDPIDEARQKAMVQLAGMLFDQADESVSSASRGRGLAALARGLGGAGESAESSDRTRIVLHLGQAIDSQTQNNDNQAVVELEHALNLGLRQPAAYYDLGLLLKSENPERALRYLQQSVKNPDFSLASYLLIAQIYENDSQLTEAVGAYIQALALADAQVVPPEQADELLSQYDAMADTFGGATDDPAALQATCKAVYSQLMRPDWRSFLAKARQNLPPQPEGSPPVPVAEMVLQARSSQVVEAMAQVQRLAAKGMLRSALEEALYALQYAPNYLPLHVLIADLHLQDGRPGEAVQKYLVVSELYSVRGEVSRAVRILRRISQIMPMDLGVRQRLIDLLVAQDKIDEALQEYLNLAEMYYRLAELDKARQTYLDALNVAKKSKENRAWGVNLLLKVADIDLQRLNLRQALRVYEQIRAIQPDNPSVRAQIVNLNFRLGQAPAAMKELDEYLGFLETANRRPDAIQFVNDLLIDQSARIDLRRRLADLYLRNNQTTEAITQLDAAADSLLSTGKHYEAINLLETIVSLNPPNVKEYRAALESLRREMLRK